MSKQNPFKNPKIQEDDIIIDTSDWAEQNEKDYAAWMSSNLKVEQKEFVFTYYELEDRERKEYEVNYKLTDKGYIPYIKKYVINNDGKIERKYVQVGRLLSPLEFDAYLLQRYEKKVMAEKKNDNTPNVVSKKQNNKPVRIGDDMPDFLL